uniref:Transposase Tc1-like domain-containing protein n=1 Tax=Oryzias latipes TaxID=8090 RepID=A0A3B3HQR2_ORYLA
LRAGINSQSVISRLKSRHRTIARVWDRHRRGAPPVTDHNHDQYLRTSAFRHGLSNATQLQAHLPNVRVIRVSRQTIHNRLHRFNLNARRLLQATVHQIGPVTSQCKTSLVIVDILVAAQAYLRDIIEPLSSFNSTSTPTTFCSLMIMLHHMVLELSQIDFRK